MYEAKGLSLVEDHLTLLAWAAIIPLRLYHIDCEENDFGYALIHFGAFLVVSNFSVFVGVRPTRFAVLALHDRLAVVFVAIRHPVMVLAFARWTVNLAGVHRRNTLITRYGLTKAELHHRVTWVN